MHSLPVIATRTGGIPLAYADREELLLVPRGDEKALAKAIEEIVQNVDLRRRLIQNGYNRTQELRTGYTAARQHAELILGRRPPTTTPVPNARFEVVA
jgi:glycosyltransferase involved in cell wall biosynthesis